MTQQIMDKNTEYALIARAGNGDEEAMNRLLAIHYHSMYCLALKFTRDRERALDALQESCIQVMKHIGQFRFEARFRTWMARIVINCVRLGYRSDRRLVPSGDRVHWSQPDLQPDPEQRTSDRQLLAHAVGLLEDGRDGDYALFLSRFVDGESIKGISDATGISVPSVKTRVHRARLRLKASMGTMTAAAV